MCCLVTFSKGRITLPRLACMPQSQCSLSLAAPTLACQSLFGTVSIRFLHKDLSRIVHHAGSPLLADESCNAHQSPHSLIHVAQGQGTPNRGLRSDPPPPLLLPSANPEP